MSLLMEALKRAETSKQEAARRLAGGDSTPASGEKLSLEPLPAGRSKTAFNPLPDLATHLDAVDADLATAPRPEIPPPAKPTPPPAAEKHAAESAREAVRNAFKAKLAVEPLSKRPLWLALGTLGFAALAIGAYVWFQLNSIGGNMLSAPNSQSAARAMPPPRVAARPVPAVPITPPTVFASPDQSTAADSQMAAEPPRLSPPRPEYRPARAPQADAEAGPSVPIRLSRTRPEPDANLLRGYSNIQQNELEFARRDFEQALQRDPNNTDALLALAAIAQRQGRPADAEYFYQRAMLANPGDPAVQAAALSGTAAMADPQTTESRLKTLLAAQPESGPLNFTLGNLYARQGRWSEAQQVYFNAVAVEGDHPDYLFNLAVSLDHIRQIRPAAQHYRLALEAADRRPAAFDRAQVRQRLTELQPEPPR